MASLPQQSWLSRLGRYHPRLIAAADVIERLYRELVNYFIAEELAAWQAQQPASD